MAKKIKKRKGGKKNNGKQIISLDINRVKHIVDADVFMAGIIKGLHNFKLPYPGLAIPLAHNINVALERTPAHNGTARWDRQGTTEKGEKFICNNCLEIAYYPHTMQKDGRCGYRFCPNCGCLMDEDMELPPAVKRVEA